MSPRKSPLLVGPATFPARNTGESAADAAQAAPFLSENVDRTPSASGLAPRALGRQRMRTPFGKQPSGLRLERMQGSSRYRDGAFQNVHPQLPGLRAGAMPSLGDFLCSGGRRVPGAPLSTLDPRPTWQH